MLITVLLTVSLVTNAWLVWQLIGLTKQINHNFETVATYISTLQIKLAALEGDYNAYISINDKRGE